MGAARHLWFRVAGGGLGSPYTKCKGRRFAGAIGHLRFCRPPPHRPRDRTAHRRNIRVRITPPPQPRRASDAQTATPPCSGTRNGFRPRNAQPRPTPSKLFQSSATQWVPSRAYFWRDDLCVIRDHRVAVSTAGRDRARPSRSARLTYPVIFQSRRFITTPSGENPKPGRSRTAMPP